MLPGLLTDSGGMSLVNKCLYLVDVLATQGAARVPLQQVADTQD